MLTADQRKELEALEAELRLVASEFEDYSATVYTQDWADRIAAVLADGVTTEESK